MLNHPHPRTLMVAGAMVALAVALSACGGGGTHTSSGNSSTTTGGAGANSSDGASNGGNGGGGFPGASGSVAAISGSSMEVQNQQTGQVTVSWTSSTSFTKTTTVSAATIAVGDCVAAIGSNSNGAVTANTVTISHPNSSGSCTGGLGGRGSGGRGGFLGGAPPNRGSVPNGGSIPNRPSGSFPGRGSGFSFASGKVTSVNSTSLVLYGTSSSGFARIGSRTSTPPTSIKPTSVTITVNSATRYSETQSTSAAALAVGDCVTANGSTDTTGAVTARNIRITSTGGQSCTNGFAPGGGSTNG